LSDVETSPAVVRRWAPGPLPHDVEAALERLARSDDVRRIAVMPDVHLSAEVCVGTVVATRHTLYPGAVGGDIGCGVAAQAFDADDTVLRDTRRAAAVIDGLSRAIPIVRHGRKRAPGLPTALEERRLSAPSLEALKKEDGALQVGTLGRGNHFVELQVDDEGRLWLMLHSGSRGMGQAIRDHNLRQCSTGRAGLRFLEADSPEGLAYLQDLEWAITYPEESRRAMVAAVRAVLEVVLDITAEEGSYVSCSHNHVRRETHDGETLWVHRKGAMPAAQGEPGLIPGSMGTRSFHVEGRGCAEALGSSAHGAGRQLSRTDARRRISVRDVTRDLRGVWFDHRLASGLREEAPSAYKDIDAVMRTQHELVRIVRRLRPVLSFKGV
jgi:tRNA-splicing ligase RtcB (3'-phosphate/5'-hydroxy nucleic acid ligase)